MSDKTTSTKINIDTNIKKNSLTKVLYLGPKFSFANLSALKYFGKQFEKDVEFIPVTTFKDLFEGVSKAKDNEGENTENFQEQVLAVVPIENSLAGSVIPNFDFLCKYDVKIIGEVCLPIQHNLYAQKGTKITDIRTVYSHPKALEQCQNFIQKHMFLSFETNSTAQAIKDVSQNKNLTKNGEISCVGAIGSAEAGEYYSLKLLAQNVQDIADNWTRFLVIKSKDNMSNYLEINTEDKQGKKINKATLIFGLPHISGSLASALTILAKYNNQILKIESRPIPQKPFEYVFYIDVYFDDLTKFKQSLIESEQLVINFRNMGVYTQAQ